MDIETYNKDGKLYPYLLCWYDGTISKSYWIADFNNYDSLLSAVIGDLAIRKYRGYKIYLHNFSNFDGIFLLKGLSKLGKCSPIINDGKFISLTFIKNISKKTSYTLHFRDSYLILPSSLKNLCKSFNSITSKDIFPVKFNDINHIGVVPNIKYFNNISDLEYNEYLKIFIENLWSFKEHALKYCLKDCISLHQVLIKFNELVFNKFKLNITEYTTLPSLSMANFRA